jgi:crotonobetainyl-CoA:carnitine CoA-transferase CaiB-like acyl-CoA transferase
VEALAGIVVADFTRYLPGPFASRELLRRGARVVRVETPDGDPLRDVAPGWDAALNGGKESVVWDLERDPELGRQLCAHADVVLEGFRPGVAEKLGIGAADVPESVVYCSITGFGPNERRAGTTSTTSAGRASSPTPPRLSRRCRSRTSREGRSTPSSRSSPRSSNGSAPVAGGTSRCR